MGRVLARVRPLRLEANHTDVIIIATRFTGHATTSPYNTSNTVDTVDTVGAVVGVVVGIGVAFAVVDVVVAAVVYKFCVVLRRYTALVCACLQCAWHRNFFVAEEVQLHAVLFGGFHLKNPGAILKECALVCTVRSWLFCT